jgi:glucose dehydrogenase
VSFACDPPRSVTERLPRVLNHCVLLPPARIGRNVLPMRTLPVAAFRAAGAASAVFLAVSASSAAAQARPDAPPAPKQVAPPTSKGVNWNAWGGDGSAQKYSPLADINRTNVKDLKVAWTWDVNEQPIAASDGQKPARPGQFQATPLAINDTLIFSTPYNRVIAMEAMTGKEYWAFDPEPWKGYGQPSNGTGLVHRGVAT